MTQTVPVPLWLLILIVAFAGVAALTHLLLPSVRWFFRRRMERVVARLNARLDRPIKPFKLMERQDMIVRLVHDPSVMEAVVDHARASGQPESVAFQQARAYAREIVPSFSATVYFGFATRAARWLTGLFYDVRVSRVDAGPPEAGIGGIDPDATVIFVMNHRSNMDYVLVTWIVADRSALSYAVGEWARVWPLSRLIRAMGAYFIRRRQLTPLYRRVLARYVQMATAEGSTQAIFPEGGLSLDGRVGAAKLGLLGYILAGFEPARRDVVFLPVGLCYDRVIEDRLLVEAAETGVRRFRAGPLSITGFGTRLIWRKLRGRYSGFGTAAVVFGRPLSLRLFLQHRPESAGLQAEALATRLMAEVTACVPVLPVPLVAAALVDAPLSRPQAEDRVTDLVARLAARQTVLHLPEGDAARILAEGLRPLLARRIVADIDGVLAPVAGKAALLAFHAAPVRQLLEDIAAAGPRSDAEDGPAAITLPPVFPDAAEAGRHALGRSPAA
jgi:glycerol-3-phosphate O-acyltransferase